MADTALTYIAAEKMFLSDADKPRRIQAGTEFKYAGLPSANMIPTCDEGRKRREAAMAYDKKGRFDNPAPVDATPESVTEAAKQAVAKAKIKAKKLEAGDAELA